MVSGHGRTHPVRIRGGVFPKTGAQSVAEIKPRAVANVVKAIEKRGAGEMAGRALHPIKAVFRNALID
jgi:hypothetical protein